MYVCAGNACMAASGPGGGLSIGLSGTPDQLSEISMAGNGTCLVTRGPFGHDSFDNAYPYGSGKVGVVTTGATATATVKSLIVYGN